MIDRSDAKSQTNRDLCIWIVNPFDLLPNETDVSLRYWSISQTLANLGHEVTWWSSDFSHLTKRKRKPVIQTGDFEIRLVNTPPYKKNVSIARVINHRIFASKFYENAMNDLSSGNLNAPDRIFVSLPPLGVAERAFKIRDYVNTNLCKKSYAESFAQSATTTINDQCKVIVDVMDAWPEAFHRILPKPFRNLLGPILLARMHNSAYQAYSGADKISAVGQSYLDLAMRYIDKHHNINTSNRRKNKFHLNHSLTHLPKPTFLCFHGADLERFHPNNTPTITTKNIQTPLQAVYLGAINSGYDLMTVIELAALWKSEDSFPFQIHIAGTGPELERLKDVCRIHELTEPHPNNTNFDSSFARVIFHGFINKDASTKLLLNSDVALVPNKTASMVACPYKASEYAAAGLPMISCLKGEFSHLINTWRAGCEYEQGNIKSLQHAFSMYQINHTKLREHSVNALSMAMSLFDRSKTYKSLATFICT